MPIERKEPKRFGSNANRPAMRAWRTQEKDAARRIGGQETSRSGAGDEKGDARKKNVVSIECKSTAAKSFSITLDMLLKIENAACNRGEMPMIQVIFVDAAGKKLKGCCVLPDYALDLVSPSE